MKRTVGIIILYLFLIQTSLYPGLLINEFVTNTSGDWVELFLSGAPGEKMDISGLFVTMYYGANEKLSNDPVTIYSYDRPETPYDDRFVVVYLTRPDKADETDLTGDTNGNGYIEVYCNNYFASLWNTDGVVAIDTDDDPTNGGMIDFVYYSNRDGAPTDTMASYARAAQSQGQWAAYDGENLQECAVPIGKGGLASYMSVSRKGRIDTNTAADFAVTNVQTPGKPNMTLNMYMGKRLFKPVKKKITIIPGHRIFGGDTIPVFVFASCYMKLRIFTMTGMLIHESPLFPSVKPGLVNLSWNPLLQRSVPPTGLYLCKIEAVNPSLHISEDEIIYILLSHYR